MQLAAGKRRAEAGAEPSEGRPRKEGRRRMGRYCVTVLVPFGPSIL